MFFFEMFFYFRPSVGLPKMQERIQSHQFADITVAVSTCDVQLVCFRLGTSLISSNHLKTGSHYRSVRFLNGLSTWLSHVETGWLLPSPSSITGRRARLRLVRVCQTGTWSRTRTSSAWWFHGDFQKGIWEDLGYTLWLFGPCIDGLPMFTP